MGQSEAVDKSLPPTPALGGAPSKPNENGVTNDGVHENGRANGDATTPSQPQQEQAPVPPKPGKKSGQEEKKEMMEKMQPSKPTDLAQQKGDRWAMDPVTGQDVLIRDLNFKGMSQAVR